MYSVVYEIQFITVPEVQCVRGKNVTACVTLGNKHVTRSALGFDKAFRVIF